MEENGQQYRQLNLVGFTLDAMQPLALFRAESGEMTFPLWLELSDVLAITADLLTNRLAGRVEKSDFLDALLGTIGLEVTEVLVDGSATQGYVSTIRLTGDGKVVNVSVGMVAALVAAIRFKLPVSISAEAIASSSLVDQREVTHEAGDETHLLALLERLAPEDMGKYPM